MKKHDFGSLMVTDGEGNSNLCQYSCLENPMDGGAWWAAVYGVAQSRTQLKWLSSSSSMVTEMISPLNHANFTQQEMGFIHLPVITVMEGWSGCQALDIQVRRGSPLVQVSVALRGFWTLIQFMRFSWQVYWGGLPFPPAVDHFLSET